MNVGQFRFERLTDHNLVSVQRLFLEVFHKKISIGDLRRKYDTSYTGSKYLTYLAFDKARPIAFYGALPQVFSSADETFLGVHICDSITHPDYQRQGLYGILARRAYTLMQEHGIRFVYGFHSDVTLRACAPLGWRTHHQMRVHRIPSGFPPVATIFRRMPLLGHHHDRLSLKVLQSQVRSRDPFDNSCVRSKAMGVRYSPEFFAYKSFTPNAIVDVGTCRAWVRSGAGLWVGDLQFDDPQALDFCISGLKRLARRLGCGHILFQTSPGTALNTELNSMYQGADSWIVGWLPFDDIELAEPWQTNFGDLDTF